MEKLFSILAYVGLAVMLVGLGFVCGRRSGKVDVSKTETTAHDTLWVEIHDTCWNEVAVTFLRTDTVRLAQVVMEHDTIAVHDSVYVEIPIEQKIFVGDHWRITAHGYMVGLDDVWFERQVITTTTTQTKYTNKRWNFNVGAQIGYGYTVHGASPYAGVGVAFGYTF